MKKLLFAFSLVCMLAISTNASAQWWIIGTEGPSKININFMNPTGSSYSIHYTLINSDNDILLSEKLTVPARSQVHHQWGAYPGSYRLYVGETNDWWAYGEGRWFDLNEATFIPVTLQFTTPSIGEPTCY